MAPRWRLHLWIRHLQAQLSLATTLIQVSAWKGGHPGNNRPADTNSACHACFGRYNMSIDHRNLPAKVFYWWIAVVGHVLRFGRVKNVL